MSVTHLIPPPGYRFRPPWYSRPWFYISTGVLAVFAGGLAAYIFSLVADLKAQARTFDLDKLEQMESASVILDRKGKIFGQIYVENRETVPYDQLPRDLINAVVAVEDAKFYQHHGYDLLGIIRAALKNLTAGQVRQGASTITQQLARNSFSLKERTYRRKLLEVFLARRIEEQFDKQKIMELYLNRIYFGGGLYGAEAAARGYFGKSAREMSLAECTTLAGLIKSPNKLSPWADRAASREARNYTHQPSAEYAASFRKAKAHGTMTNQPAPEYLQGAVIGLDNETGDILVLVGGRDFEHNQYDRALQARRPAGTAMLPFAYAAAFEKGMFPGSLVEDSPLDNRAVMIGGTTGILGEWGPESAENRYEGAITARQALTKSKNGATVRIGMNAGVDSVLQLCSAAGIRSPLRPYPATFLGSSEITLAELALAYTIFPNGGWRPKLPHVLERIEEKDGTVWHAQRDYGKQNVIKPEIAYEVHSCLVNALDKGTGKAARTNFGLKKMEAAGKTGTAYDFTDVLFAGYDSAITCAVWAGFDKPQKIFRGAFGHDIALPVWVDVMNASTEHYLPKDISQPRGLERVNICAKSGLLATDKCVEKIKTSEGETEEKTTYLELVTSDQKPIEPCNVHGELHASLTRDLPPSEFPRAALAVDTNAVTPITPKGPTHLAARDPYNSVPAMVYPKPASSPPVA